MSIKVSASASNKVSEDGTERVVLANSDDDHFGYLLDSAKNLILYDKPEWRFFYGK